MTQQQLARYEDGGLSTLQLGQVFKESGYFQDVREASQAVVKILAGKEMGIGPIAAMTGIYIVKGRVTLSANLMAAQIKRSGKYSYRIRRMDDTGCEIEFFEQGQSIGVSTFDEADAKAAGLAGGENWKKFPRNMYFARAMSNGAKWYCPDVFSGPVYTPEELSILPMAYETVDTTTGEIIDAPGANYTPPAEEAQSDPAPAKRAAPKRETLLKRIAELTEQAVREDLEIELVKPLEQMTDAELIQHGQNLRAALDEAARSGEPVAA